MSRTSKTITFPLPPEMAEQVRQAMNAGVAETSSVWKVLGRGGCPDVRA